MHQYSENNLMDFHYGIQASLFPKTFLKTLNYSLLIDPPPKHAECWDPKMHTVFLQYIMGQIHFRYNLSAVTSYIFWEC